MASPLIRFLLVNLLFLMISFFQLSLHKPLSHKDERLALMQFKDSFVIEKHVSTYPFAYPKVHLWKSQGIDCCSWEGIWCDQYTGHITGLDLSNSRLFGSINSNSSLFHLTNLEYLNLAFNDFNYSEIPSALGNLSRLAYLNLSTSSFYGQVPWEVSKLSKLAMLDLSFNLDYSYQGLLELKNPDLNSLIRNFTRLEYLDLSFVNIKSPIPSALANLSSLTFLCLTKCELFGKFPITIFQLSKLEYLYVDDNWGLSGSLPEFHFSNPLKALSVANTSFSSEFPTSFGLLSSLEYLQVRNCNFSGLLPYSLSNLTELTYFDLMNNSFKGSKSPFWSNLMQLTAIILDNNQFTFSEIPSFVGLTFLSMLSLSNNHITGQFPSWLVNLTQLTYLSLSDNMLEGSLPSSISRLKNLEVFDVGSNNLSGIIEFQTFLGLKSLKQLFLFDNTFSLLTKTIINSTIPKFIVLELGSCNLREFPDFLHSQDQLSVLGLSFNNIHGYIPKWLLKMSTNLWFLGLGNNFLTSFEESSSVIPSGLLFLDLSSNFLTGSLPIPPPSMLYYTVVENKFNGGIPPQFCNITSPQILDLSHNNLTGIIPQCFGNLSKSLLILNLEENNFLGTIPDTWAIGNELKVIKLGHNNLQGKLPRSLANCNVLEHLDLGNNQIKDTFPSWLGVLLQLKIIILCFNGFYGATSGPWSNLLFPKLRIIDLSHNEFVGPLPLDYFKRWNVMANLGGKNKTYLQADYNLLENDDIVVPLQVPYTMTITNKGEKMEYTKIIEIFTAIDLSCNKFAGEIPEVVATLTKLQLLNLSNNMLIGPIPPTLGYLKNLEALDISHNKLTGRIPSLLMQLNFLEVFNVSYNNLIGSIPKGQQFDTFESSSFKGNARLCGMPLPKKCDDSKSKALPPSSTSKEDPGLLAEFGWKVVFLGYGCGFIVGVVIGIIVFTRKPKWFMKTFRIKQRRGRKSGRERLNKRMT